MNGDLTFREKKASKQTHIRHKFRTYATEKMLIFFAIEFREISFYYSLTRTHTHIYSYISVYFNSFQYFRSIQN